MASRPRRSVATKANESISVHAKWADASDKSDRNPMASRRSGRASGASVLRDASSSPSDLHISVSVQPSSKPRQPARASGRRSERFEGGQIVTGTRNRGGRKNYVIDSSPDDDDDMDELGDDDAEGEEMDVDAEGEDIDAEGDVAVAMRAPPAAPTIRVSQPSTSRSAARVAASKMAAEEEDEEDEDEDEEDELSDPGESDNGDQTMGFADETMADEEADEDAEGDEIEVAGEEEEAGGGEAESDEDGSRAGTPDLTKMTKRQRARFEDEPQEYMKLSDEVQAKKHFTAEELSMRRQEMARRRRNLSEKRNEEVKASMMETINKLLKKQAPKINRRAAAAAARAATPDEEEQKASPVLIRWVNNRDGSRVSVPDEILAGPAGKAFAKGGLASGKMVEEVA